MHVKKGDKVVVITGKNKGKTGIVKEVLPKKNRVIVEGVNMVVKHQKPSQAMPQGGRIEKEGSIDASNVMLYSDKAGKGVRVGYKIEDGKKVRICKKTGETI
ncbi:MAG: 50S ribosomal protein L24 [Andreesenia angusta]|nr:50S ribosomal protein L24 [Andreesenia angusta]